MELAAPRSLKETFLDRAISVGTMTAALRGLTAVALAAVALAAVLVGLRSAGLPSVPLGSEGGLQSAMPSVTFWASIVLLSLAWSYLLGGLLHAHRLVRLAAPAAFGFGVYELLNLGLPVETWRIAPAFVFAAAVGAVSLGVLREEGERLRLATLPLLFLLVLGFYLSFWWRLRPLGDRRFYTLAIYHQLAQLSFALIPLLLVTGVDFAEWGHAAAGRAAEIVRGLRPAGAALAAAGVLAYAVGVRGTAGLPWHLGMAAIFAALVALAVGSTARRVTHPHVPYAAIFGSALALTGIVLGIVYSASPAPQAAPGGQPTLRSEAPGFRLDYPAGWRKQQLPEKGGLKIWQLSSPKSEAAQFYAVYLPPPLARKLTDPLTAIFKATATAPKADGPWQRRVFQSAAGTLGVAWQRSVGRSEWLLAGVAAPSTFRSVIPLFQDITASWTTRPAAPVTAARYTSADRAIEGSALAWLALAIAAAGGLAFLRRRESPRRLAPSLCFVAVAGFYFALVELPTLGYTLFGASSRNAWPQLTLVGLEQLVAMLTLAALLTRAGRRAATELIGLNLGLFAVYWLDRAISSGMSAGRLSVVASVLVLFALLWEVVMSGEAITNRHDERFPRHARVLVYFGYIVGVATAVLFFSSISTPHGSVQPLFENENFSDTGLLFLGTALVVTLFILRAPRWRARAQSAE